MRPFPAESLRTQFPALERAKGFLFFDNAAGAQVPRAVIEAIDDHFIARGVQRGGPYRQSREVDAMIERARESVAILLNAPRASEIAFGMNATSFIRAISLAIGHDLSERQEIVVTELDHEANIATWLALERLGARIRWWRVRDDGLLYVEDLEPLVGQATRIVACPLAANSTGTIVDVTRVSALARRAGADTFVDAVHYGPHGPIDVQALGCDYLVCSGYKIFGPHMGFAWCRTEAIARLQTFREEFIPDAMPWKLEAGTFVYENVAGMDAAIRYLESIGTALGGGSSRRAAVEQALTSIREYEQTLSAALLEALAATPGATVYGITNRGSLDGRVPTVCFTNRTMAPAAIADGLAAREIGVRSGHMYSPRIMTRLGTMPDGAVRVSLVHYNTGEEIAQFWEALGEVLAS